MFASHFFLYSSKVYLKISLQFLKVYVFSEKFLNLFDSEITMVAVKSLKLCQNYRLSAQNSKLSMFSRVKRLLKKK